MSSADSNETKAVKQLSEVKEEVGKVNRDINVMTSLIRLSNDEAPVAVFNLVAKKAATPTPGIHLNRQDLVPQF